MVVKRQTAEVLSKSSQWSLALDVFESIETWNLVSFNAALDQPVRGDICEPIICHPYVGEHDCLLDLNMVHMCICAYYMPVFLVQLPKRLRKQPEATLSKTAPKAPKPCRRPAVWVALGNVLYSSCRSL